MSVFKESSRFRKLNWIILAPIFSLGLVGIVISALITYEEFEHHFEEEIYDHQQTLVNSIQYAAEIADSDNEIARVISSLGGDKNIRLIILVRDDSLRVIASTRNALMGKLLDDIGIKGAIDSLHKSIKTESKFGGFDKEQVSYAYVSPILLSRSNIDFKLARGAVYIDIDATQIRRHLLRTALTEFTFLLTILTAITLMAFYLIRRHVLRPIGQISDAIKKYKENSEGNYVPVVGGIEISALAHVINEMSSLERRRAIELAASEERLHVVFDSVLDGIIIIDEKGRVESVNPAVIDIFGYDKNEIIGQNIKMLMPEPNHQEHDGYLKNYVGTGEKKIIGIGREVEGHRKDGSDFPLDLAVSEMFVDGQRKFTGVVRDITERRKVDHLKNEFVSSVSHELRTPLTSILGSLGLMRGGAMGEMSDQAKSMLDIAYSNCDRLVCIINDILDIEKIESGKVDFNFEVIDLAQLVERSITDNQAYAERCEVTLDILGSHPGVRVYADKDRILQIMANFLSNAAKFSPRMGHVKISITASDKTVRVSVHDSGPGIPEDFHDRIFQKFTQADASDERQKGGTGLGLSICKSLVEEHGGTIGFDSTPGEGTTFYFDIPRHLTLDELKASVLSNEEMTILVCEYDEDTASILALLLEQAGFNIDIAYTAGQVKKKLRNGTYVAMTLDLGLPDQDGISLLREIRQMEHLRNLPIIIVSAQADKEKKEINGDAIGIVDWMEKPINPERLLSGVLAAIQNRYGDQPRILHVEDDPDIVRIVATIIGDIAEIIPVGTIRDAKEIIENESFDLVILDLNLPDGTGESLLPLLSKPGRPPVPVMVFSVREMNRELADNVTATLVKSRTDNDTLIGTIRSLIIKGDEKESKPGEQKSFC
ncbi:MAG: PAS domain S-box protein [Rhodospirillaceae bacterium]|nr:PAS domain S-box protein [Rhodospirillaceae bacterium]